MAVRRTTYLEAIRERLRNNPIVSLVGPRQAGKTTLARMLAEESAEAAHFFDLESPAELARALGSSEPTARRYLDILSGTHVVRQLPPWFENLKKRQVRSPKVYVRDPGLLHALLGIPDPPGLQSHPKLGASWEGFCLEQILSVCGDRTACFWGTHGGAELDLLLPHAGRRLGFEFKFSDRPATTRSMRVALQDLALDHLFIVHPGEHEFPLDESITAIALPRLIDVLRSEVIGA